MYPAEIVIHVVKRNSVLQILQLFTERVGQSGESAHRHSHRQILALNEAGRNVCIIGIPLMIAFFAPMHTAGL